MSVSARECFTDFALQEYAQGRLDPSVRHELTAHTNTCPECRAALEAFEAEAALLRAVLQAPAADTAIPDDETLARYSAGALPPAEAAQIEALLSRHPGALQRLIRLTRETEATRCEAEAGPKTEPQSHPAGEILRMPKRITRPHTVTTAVRRASGGSSA